jgi:DNA-binding IscR family transcriptional regulator
MSQIYVMVKDTTEFAVVAAMDYLISEGMNVTLTSVAKEAGCSTRTVSRVWSRLRERGCLETIGTPRGGYIYRLRSDNQHGA